jgi:hypothetical protein
MARTSFENSNSEMNARDRLKQALDSATAGLSTCQLTEALSEGDSPDAMGAVELLCVLSPDLRDVDGTWRTTRVGKAAAVLIALENYATATGKRIFRSASALKGLPDDMLPTEEELAQIAESNSERFELLPNQMIKFHG